MTAADAPSVAVLSKQLGYPLAPEVIAGRLAQLKLSADHGFWTAVQENAVQENAVQKNAVLGWVHVYGVHLLESPAPFAEIGGLVVDVNARRQGVGRALMAQAEAWAAGHGYGEVRLRSGLHRTDAHEFYESIGYELTKTSHMFRKAVL